MNRNYNAVPSPEPLTFDLTPFVWELHRQSSFGRRAATELDALLGRATTDLDYWYPIQNLLVSAGIVSRILWPPKEKHERRGKQLRALLGTPDDSPLADRRLRDDFEHMDERIETWRRKDGIIHIDANIGPPNMFANLNKTKFTTFRQYDPATGIVSFWGAPYDLRLIVSALKALHVAASDHLPPGMGERW